MRMFESRLLTAEPGTTFEPKTGLNWTYANGPWKKVYSLPSHPGEHDMAPNVQRETTFPQGMSRRQAAPALPPGAEA